MENNRASGAGQQRQGSLYATVAYSGGLSAPLASGLFAQDKLVRHLFVLVDEGRASLTRGHTASELFPGGCWLLLPGERVQIREDGGQRLSGRIVAFDVWRVRQQEQEPGQPAGAGMSRMSATIEAAVFPVSGLLESHLTDEVRRWAEADEQAAESAAEQMAFLLSVRFLEVLSRIWQVGAERRDRLVASDAIERTVRQMEQSYAHPITRDELAKLANMSPSHYSFAFKRETGQSPMEKLAEIRIHHAKKQLLFSDRKLRDIAESVGYSNEFYFSRQFKQVIGVSPKEFARRHFAKHVKVSHPFALHLQSLGLASAAADQSSVGIRVVGLYVEDFLLALGIKPVLRCVGNSFRQSYLNDYLHDVEEWSLLSFDLDAVAEVKPDLIILGHFHYGENGRFARFSEIAPTYSMRKGLHNWSHGVRIIGQLINRLPQAEAIIALHEQRLRMARVQLEQASGKTVDLVRICNDGRIRLYGGPGGYSGVVLYQDLGLKPSASVLQHAWDKPSGYARITADVLYELQSDHLFVVVDPAGRSYWNRLAGDPRWSRLPCVQEQRCHEVRFDVWMTFGVIAHQLKVKDVLDCLAPASRAMPTIV